MIELTEQEILQDAIVAHKFLMNMYSQFGIECSNCELKKMFSALENIAGEHQLKIFEIMNEKGYYPTTPATQKDIKQALKMHTQMQNELENKIE